MNIKKVLLTAVFALVAALPFAAKAQTGSGYLMTDTEKQAIREVIKEYIRDNSDYIIQTLQESAQKQDNKAVEEQKDLLSNPPENLFNSKSSPIGGNPNGDVVVVEFFDYNCGYCKRVINDVNRLLSEDKNVKFVFKELPILSDASQVAARYALAAHKQGKYYEYHVALMKNGEHLDEKGLLRLADSIGIDIKKLQKDVYNTEIGDALTENMEVAQKMGIRGTPFFIVGDEIMPGAVGYGRLTAAISAFRSKNSGGVQPVANPSAAAPVANPPAKQ